MKKFEQHSLSAVFPPLGDEEFKLLCDDIDQNGIREPLTLFEGKIIDGWNRYRACQELNIVNPPTRSYTGTDPVGLVVSLNLHRRHLTPSQRAMSIAKLVDFVDVQGLASDSLKDLQHGNFTTPPVDEPVKKLVDFVDIQGLASDSLKDLQHGNFTTPPVDKPVKKTTLEEAAALAQVSKSSMQAAKIVVKEGDQKIQDDVLSGKISVHEAKKKVEGDKAEKPETENKKSKKIDEEIYLELQKKYEEQVDLNQSLAHELSAMQAVGDGNGVEEIKNLHQQIESLIRARDDWQNRYSEAVKQIRTLETKIKKLESR
jgi:hypothetical protein